MKPIVNLYIEVTPEGNLLKWVGNVKNRSSFHIKRSIDELNFYTLEEINLTKAEGQPYEFLDNTPPNVAAFYQIEYYEGAELMDVSQAVKVGVSKGFNLKNFLIRIGAAVALIALAMLLVNRLSKPKPAPANVALLEQERFVTTLPVAYQNHITTIRALGQVIASQPIDLVSEVAGRIEKGNILLKKAKTFQRGDLLFKIDQTEAQLNLKAQRSNFLNAVALLLPDLKLDFPKSFDKWNAYFNSLDINQNLPPLPEVTDQREKTFLATRNIAAQFYNIKSTEERLTKYAVYAPYSGVILDVFTDASSVANIGTRVLRVRRSDDLELELPVRKEDIQWVKVGTKVKILSEDQRQTTYGAVNRISSQIDPTTQSINVYVTVNAGNIKLYEGLYLYAEITGSTVPNAMEVPRRTIINSNQVFVVRDSTLFLKQVNVHKVNTETLLFSGLQAGEALVKEPFLGAAEGMKVTPTNE